MVHRERRLGCKDRQHSSIFRENQQKDISGGLAAFSSMECETPNSVNIASPLQLSDADVKPLVRTSASLEITSSKNSSRLVAEPTTPQLPSRASAPPPQVMKRRTDHKVPPQEAPWMDIMVRRRSVQIQVPPQDAPSRKKVSPLVSDYGTNAVSIHPDMISPLARDYKKRSFSAYSVGSQASPIMSILFSGQADATSTYYTSSPALARGYKRGSPLLSLQARSQTSGSL
jgi:hypothetical protein